MRIRQVPTDSTNHQVSKINNQVYYAHQIVRTIKQRQNLQRAYIYARRQFVQSLTYYKITQKTYRYKLKTLLNLKNLGNAESQTLFHSHFFLIPVKTRENFQNGFEARFKGTFLVGCSTNTGWLDDSIALLNYNVYGRVSAVEPALEHYSQFNSIHPLPYTMVMVGPIVEVHSQELYA